MRILSHLVQGIDRLNRNLGQVFAYLLVPMGAMVLFDVMMRYAFNRPTMWAYESALFTFGGYIVLSGAYALLYKAHVNVDILYGKWSPRTRAILDVCTAILFFLFMWFMLRQAISMTILSWQTHETTNTLWQPPVYPLKTTLPIACMLLMLQGGAKLIRDLYMAATGKELPNG